MSQIEMMAEALHYESPRLRRHPFDVDHLRQAVMKMITEPNMLALVAKKGHEAIGMMAAVLGPGLTTKALTLGELVLYVKPEYRGGRAALKMIRAFEASSPGYDKVAGTSLGICDDDVLSFYKRLGYTPSGYVFYKAHDHV